MIKLSKYKRLYKSAGTEAGENPWQKSNYIHPYLKL